MNLPHIEETQPEYLTWPLEKLQEEYWALNLKHLAHGIREIDKDQKLEDVDNFIAALKRLLEEV